MISRAVRRLAVRRFSTIPVNQVSYFTSFKVTGEPEAVQVREAVTAAAKGLEGSAVDLQICKAAWNVNISVTYPTLDSFKANRQSAVDALEPITQMGTDVHTQNFTMERF